MGIFIVVLVVIVGILIVRWLFKDGGEDVYTTAYNKYENSQSVKDISLRIYNIIHELKRNAPSGVAPTSTGRFVFDITVCTDQIIIFYINARKGDRIIYKNYKLEACEQSEEVHALRDVLLKNTKNLFAREAFGVSKNNTPGSKGKEWYFAVDAY